MTPTLRAAIERVMHKHNPYRENPMAATVDGNDLAAILSDLLPRLYARGDGAIGIGRAGATTPSLADQFRAAGYYVADVTTGVPSAPQSEPAPTSKRYPTAFIVGFFDTDTARFVGAGLFSDENPTMGANRWPVTLATGIGVDFEDGIASLREQLEHPFGHWLRLLFAGGNDRTAFDRASLGIGRAGEGADGDGAGAFAMGRNAEDGYKPGAPVYWRNPIPEGCERCTGCPDCLTNLQPATPDQSLAGQVRSAGYYVPKFATPAPSVPPAEPTRAATGEALSEAEQNECIQAVWSGHHSGLRWGNVRGQLRGVLDGSLRPPLPEWAPIVLAKAAELRARRPRPLEAPRPVTQAGTATGEADYALSLLGMGGPDKPIAGWRLDAKEHAALVAEIRRLAERVDYLTGAVSVESERGEKAEREAEENDASWGEKIAQVRAERDEAQRDVKQHLVYFGLIAEAIGIDPRIPPSSIVSAVGDAFSERTKP